MADEGGGKFTIFLAGLGVGALLAILFAPRSGEETRDLLEDTAEDGRDYLTRKGREARRQAERYVDETRKAIAREKRNIQTGIEAGKQAYREASAADES